MRWLPAAICLVLSLLCAAPRAHAQGKQDEPPASYVDLVERALAESQAGRWPEALALFRQAHAVYPNARSHRGIGMVAFEVRDYVEAARHLQQALSSSQRPLDDAQRAEVSSLLERTRAFLARYSLSGLPASASITVDGRSAVREPDGTLLLALGAHHVEVHAADPERHGAAELDVKGGEREALPIVLEPVAPAPAAVAPNAVEAASADAAEAQATIVPDAADPGPERATEGPKVTGVLLTATGGALLVAGAVLLVVGLGDVSKVEDQTQPVAWSDEFQSAKERAPVFTGIGIGLMSAGGALAIGGAVIWIGGGDADEDGEADAITLRMRGWL